MMASIIDNLTREDVVKMEIERRRMEELGEIVGYGLFLLMCLFLAHAFVNCF